METSGHTGCFRNILPESVAEFERRLADAGKRFRASVFVPGFLFLVLSNCLELRPNDP